MFSRSSCANADKIPIISLPVGLVVSIDSFKETKSTPFSLNTSSIRYSVSFCDLLSLSNLNTITHDILLLEQSDINLCISGRLIVLPE